MTRSIPTRVHPGEPRSLLGLLRARVRGYGGQECRGPLSSPTRRFASSMGEDDFSVAVWMETTSASLSSHQPVYPSHSPRPPNYWKQEWLEYQVRMIHDSAPSLPLGGQGRRQKAQLSCTSAKEHTQSCAEDTC